jgi:hypothetical protein
MNKNFLVIFLFIVLLLSCQNPARRTVFYGFSEGLLYYAVLLSQFAERRAFRRYLTHKHDL